MDDALRFFATFLSELWRLSVEAAPYLVLGFGTAAVLLYAVPREWMTRFLARGRFRSTVTAAAIGAPLPLCSCSVVPTAAAMHRQGASRGATLSFLISTPETGVDSILLTYGLLGPVMALFRPAAAIVSAIGGGLILETVSPARPEGEPKREEGRAEGCGDCDCEGAAPSGSSSSPRWFRGIIHSFLEVFDDVAIWLAAGLAGSAALAVGLPEDWLAGGWGDGWTGMALAALIGAPMYVCATSSTPLAMVLMAKGLSPGATLVFLLVGPAMNLGSMGVVWRMFGKRGAAVYLGSIVGTAFAFGGLINAWYPDLAPQAAIAGEERHGSEVVWGLSAAGLWVLMIQRACRGVPGWFRGLLGRGG